MTSRVGASLLIAAIASCATQSPRKDLSTPPARVRTPVTWSPVLGLPSIPAIPSRLAAPFPEPYEVAALAPDRTTRQGRIKDCGTYFELRQGGYEPMSQPDLAAMRIDGAGCYALRLLQAGRPASDTPVRAFSLQAGSLGELPAALGPSVNPADRDRRSQATSASKSWASIDPDARLTVADAWTASVKATDWSTDLRVLARGDLDGDGLEDLLVETVSTGAQGSWSEVRLRLLTSAPGSRVLRISREFPL